MSAIPAIPAISAISATAAPTPMPKWSVLSVIPPFDVALATAYRYQRECINIKKVNEEARRFFDAFGSAYTGYHMCAKVKILSTIAASSEQLMQGQVIPIDMSGLVAYKFPRLSQTTIESLRSCNILLSDDSYTSPELMGVSCLTRNGEVFEPEQNLFNMLRMECSDAGYMLIRRSNTLWAICGILHPSRLIERL